MQNVIKWMFASFFVCIVSVAGTACNRQSKAIDGNQQAGQSCVQICAFLDAASDSILISVDQNSFDFALYSENGLEMITATDCQNSYTVDASSLSNGDYILNIIIDEDIFMKHVTVKKI